MEINFATYVHRLLSFKRYQEAFDKLEKLEISFEKLYQGEWCTAWTVNGLLCSLKNWFFIIDILKVAWLKQVEVRNFKNYTILLEADSFSTVLCQKSEQMCVRLACSTVHRSQYVKGMLRAENACYLWSRNKPSILKRLLVFMSIMERLFKVINEFYVRIYFIDQNDIFKKQNKISILVESGHFLESQFWVSFQISQKATMILENYFHDLLVYIQNFIFTNFCHKEMSQIGYTVCNFLWISLIQPKHIILMMRLRQLRITESLEIGISLS